MGEIADDHAYGDYYDEDERSYFGDYGMRYIPLPFRGRSEFRHPPNKTAQLDEFDLVEDEVGRKENVIEKYLRDQVKSLGGEHRKVVYQGRTGSPDDWCFMPGGILLIVECKAPGKRPDPHQADEIEWLCSMGFKASWVDSKESIDALLAPYKEVDFL